MVWPLALKISQSVRCIPCVIHRKPELFKVLCRNYCNFLAILHEQHGSLSSAWLAVDRLGFLFNLDRRISRRQINTDRRAVSWLAVYRRRSAGLFREAVHLAQTQTGPLSRSLGREKRIKNVRQGRSRNANAGISQFERHKCAAQGISASAAKKRDPANCQRQDAAIRHGVAGVHTEV